MKSVEGSISLHLGVGDGPVTRVSVNSDRLVGASSILENRVAEEAIALLPRLFSICGKAQAAAGRAAVEAAMGMRPSPDEESRRRRMVLAEFIREHCWRILIDWPPLLGLAPDVAAMAAVNSLLAPPLRGEEGGLDQLEALVRSIDMGARLLDRLEAEGWAGLGASDVGPLPGLDPARLESLMGGGGARDFLARPSWDGVQYQTGPLARRWDAAPVAMMRKSHGAGAGAMIAARIEELAALPGLLGEEGGVTEAWGENGVGLGVIEAARGRLVHRVELADGRVKSWHILAPTEWNFHPQGPLTGLLGLAMEKAENGGRLLASLIDPCVPCNIMVDGHA